MEEELRKKLSECLDDLKKEISELKVAIAEMRTMLDFFIKKQNEIEERVNHKIKELEKEEKRILWFLVEKLIHLGIGLVIGIAITKLKVFH